MGRGEKKPWLLLWVLLVAMMPATGNMFLYSFAMLPVAREWGLSPSWAALIGFLPMAANPVGGMLFGSFSDRHGRRNALLISIVLTGLSAALSGLAFSPYDFALYRLLLGMSFGAQWAVSMTLVSEVWPAHERGRAVGIVQTSFPVGFLYASLLAFLSTDWFGWRILLMMGGLPVALAAPLAYFTIKESRLWIDDPTRGKGEKVSYSEVLRRPFLRYTVLGIATMFIGSFGAWAINPWIPAYLGVLGVPGGKVALFTTFIMLGALAGYSLFGFISDGLGRKLTFQVFFVGMAGALAAFGLVPSAAEFTDGTVYSVIRIIGLGGLVAFFLGYFSGYGALFAELFPTRLRSRGIALCYSIGLIGSSVGPASTGYLSSKLGLGHTFAIVSVLFLIGAVLVQPFPETRGKKL